MFTGVRGFTAGGSAGASGAAAAAGAAGASSVASMAASAQKGNARGTGASSSDSRCAFCATQRSGAERTERGSEQRGKVYRTDSKATVPPLPGASRGCAAASSAPAVPRGSASCLSVRPRPVFRAVERCLPPAPSWARRWALACSCTATPCASCRCCAVRARTRNQRAANGPCAPTLSALHPSAADPWEHVVAAGLGGMVGSYVVAWEVRAQRSAVGHPASRPCTTLT